MNTWNRKLLSAMLCLAMLAGMLFVGVQPIRAEDGRLDVTENDGNTANPAYTYTSENHTLTVHDGANITISGITTTDHIVVEGEAAITLDGVSIQFSNGTASYGSANDSDAGTCAFWIGENAQVTLTLAGTNTLKSGAGRAGINVASTASLTIGGTGSLDVTGGNCAAGIGGGLWNNAGSIAINGGTINATGTADGAGIGGGHANDALSQSYGGFESITINGGTVTATSTGNAAGIGTGCWSTQQGTITIENATVTASTAGTAGACAAIGQGVHGNNAQALTITISNSTITATNANGAQISGDTGSNITNSLVAQGFESVSDYDIYGSYTLGSDFSLTEGQTLTIDSKDTLNLGDHTLTNQGTIVNYGMVNGNGKIANNGYIYNAGTIPANSVSGNMPISITYGSYQYLDASGIEQTSPSNTEVIASATPSLGVSESTGEQWYIVLGNVSFERSVAVFGDVHLILADGSSLTAKGGLNVSNDPLKDSLTIYGQSQGTGQLISTGSSNENHAGIGGPWYGRSCGTVTINGGIVSATGGTNAAGIGGGAYGNGGSVTINGGFVTITGGTDAPSIGAGNNGNSEGTFSTGGNGHAIIYAYDGIKGQSQDTNWRGVIFTSETSGQVYGDQTLSYNLTIPEKCTFTIPENTTLTIPKGVTLTNNGTIKGTGSIVVYGTLDGARIVESVNVEYRTAVTGVSLNQETLSMTVSDTAQLTATVQPADAYNQAVSWSSSNTDVATVDGNGLITAVAPGTAIITVTTEDGGFSAQCTVTVQDNEPPYNGSYNYPVTVESGDHGTVTLDKADQCVTGGERVTFGIMPDDAYKLDVLTIIDRSGNAVDVTDNGDGTFSFTMPESAVTITATFVEDPNWQEPEEPSTDVNDIFTDVAADAWYKDVVQYVYDNGLMTGTSATTFEPDTTTSRAMIVSILHRLEGAPADDNAGFTDASEDDWYAEPVNWAASVGIIGGFGDGSFQPNNPLTREQMASVLYRYAQYKGFDVSARADLTGYADADQIGDWAYDVMRWANAEGLLNGVTDDQLQPQGTATRAQVAAMLQRFIENVL